MKREGTMLGMEVYSDESIPPSEIRLLPHINIVDTYTKDGAHLRSVATTPNGRVIWDEGRTPSKDVTFFPGPPRTPEPETEKP